MVKAVLFDFDGVLTLDETGSQSICNYIAQAMGIEKSVISNEYRKYNRDLLIGKLKHEDIWQQICDGIGQKIKIAKLKVAMVTDSKVDRIKSIVTYHNWEKLFDSIAVSSEIGSGKDKTDIFYSTFQTLVVNPEECVFIDKKRRI